MARPGRPPGLRLTNPTLCTDPDPSDQSRRRSAARRVSSRPGRPRQIWVYPLL